MRELCGVLAHVSPEAALTTLREQTGLPPRHSLGETSPAEQKLGWLDYLALSNFPS